MKSRFSHSLRRPLVVLVLLALGTGPGWSLSWWGSRDNREGIVAMVRNRAVLFPAEGAAKPVSLNDAFQVGDRLRTREDSAARILFMEDSFLNIGPSTTYELTKSRYDEVTGARDVGFGVLAGKVRLAVGRLFGRGTATVETPTAVVGVKGTDIFIGYDEATKLTQVLVTQGLAEVTSKNPQIDTVTVQVSAGEYVEVSEAPVPPKPEPTPPGLVSQYTEDTNVDPDPSRSIPDATTADAQKTVQPLTTTTELGVTDTNTLLAKSESEVSGGSSEPSSLQTISNTGSPIQPPPPLPSTVPPDLCPGNCP